MTRADGITGEEAGREREPGKTGKTWGLFLHHIVPLPLLQCCLTLTMTMTMLTMTPSRPDLFLTIFRQIMKQRDLKLTFYFKRNKM